MFHKSPSVRRSSIYLKFDRAIKDKNYEVALSIGASLLIKYPGDQILRRRMAQIAYKTGQKDWSRRLLLGGLPPRLKERILKSFDEVVHFLECNHDATGYEISPAGTQAVCLAIFLQAADSESRPLAVAKVLHKWKRSHRRELEFYRRFSGCPDLNGRIPRKYREFRCGWSHAVLLLEYIDGRPAEFTDSEGVFEWVSSLRRIKRPSDWVSDRASLILIPDLLHVLFAYVLKRSLSLRYLARWLHVGPARALFRWLVNHHVRGEIGWEREFQAILNGLICKHDVTERGFWLHGRGLAHGDLNRGNVLVDGPARCPRFVGIDWENWHWGYPEFDLARFLQNSSIDFVLKVLDGNFSIVEENERIEAARFLMFFLAARLFGHHGSRQDIVAERGLEKVVCRLKMLLGEHFESIGEGQ